MQPTVTITGISGYVGSQVCLAFLKSGQFKVRGTVRSKTNQKKIDPLKKSFGDLFQELELVEADLLNKNSLIDACEGSTYIVHTASPFPLAMPKDPQEVIKPAVDGTLAIMEAAKKHKVKRVVICSSIAAVFGTKDKDKSFFNENDWSEVDCGFSSYELSKTLAEKAAWDFQANLEEDEYFEVVTINPGLILGPSLVTCQFSSADVIKKFMMGEMPGVPQIQLPTVDVRDIAQAHLKAILIEEAANRRFLMVQKSTWFIEFSLALKEYYGDQYHPPTVQLPWFACWCASFTDPELKTLMPFWGKWKFYDNSPARDILKIEFIDLKQSVCEMGDSLIETGYVPRAK